jgi:BirA family biotin operon repressor/biotin-[acetyl-CoA-carboxylase] ligase
MTQTQSLGEPRHHFEEIGSTNDEAKRLADEGAPHGTTVTARHQLSGRGRQGRAWFAPPGQALLVSVIIREQPDPTRLPLAAAVAVAKTVGGGAQIKWPNDVVFVAPTPGGPLRKVAGILCEGRPALGWSIIGIGLNAALDLGAVPAELAPRVASMGRTPEELDDVLAVLLTELQAAIALPFDDLLAEWAARDVLLGARVDWEIAGGRTGSGSAQGVDERGRLRVIDDAGQLELLDAGEVHLAALRLAP